MGLVVAGALGLGAGALWNLAFPINKSLWTSSYVLFTAAMAILFLAVFYWAIDVRAFRRWAIPFVVYGVNPITAFGLSGLLGRLLVRWTVEGTGGKRVAFKTWIYQHLASWTDPTMGSLLFALGTVLFWLGMMAILYRRRILIKL
jgi:predicted acyltransferase